MSNIKELGSSNNFALFRTTLGSRIILEKISIIEDRFTKQDPTLIKVLTLVALILAKSSGCFSCCCNITSGFGTEREKRSLARDDLIQDGFVVRMADGDENR